MAMFANLRFSVSLVVARFAGKKMNPAMKRWNLAIQNRVTETAAVLLHTKAIKVMGLESVITRFLNDLREREIEESIAFRKIRVVLASTFPLTYWFTPFIILAGAVKLTVWKNGLDPVGVWVVLSFMDAVTGQMRNIFNGWSILGGVKACLGRIQDFLLQEERLDIRQVKDLVPGSETNLNEKADNAISQSQSQTQLVSPIDGEATCSPCIVLENITVAANEADRFVLKDISLSIPANKLTVIIGPVGSGKSVLAKTLIGEIRPTGSIYTTSLQMGYCDQSAWLPDGSVQDAITMHMELDKARYDDVVEACALVRDIQELGGSQARIGSNGSKLSGGQRQRLALARALYSSCPIIVADDVLSALDRRTAIQVFQAVFDANGMLKRQGRTAILVAHERAWLSSADQVISLHCDGNPAAVYEGKEAIQMFSETEGVAIDAAYFSAHDEETSDGKLTAPEQALEYARQDEKRSAYKPDFSLYGYLFRSVPKVLVMCSIFFIMLYGFGERCPELYVRLWSGYSPQKTDYVWGMLGFMFVSAAVQVCNGIFFQLKLVPKIARQTHATFTHSVFAYVAPFHNLALF